MALIASSSFATKKPHLPLHSSPHHHHLYSNPKPRILIINSQDSSSTSNSSQPPNPTESTTTPPPPPRKLSSSAAGTGFGSSNAESPKKKQQRGKKERASIIRREPLEKPNFATQANEIRAKERSQNESAFLLAWLALGAIILVQGILLAASGFLPEEWDDFFVTYLYPSFTPTVFLFVAGTVAYGVLKYLQNENFKSDN